MNMKLLISSVIILMVSSVQAQIRPMTDDEIRDSIIDGTIKGFQGDCPCPYSKDSKGKTCGDDSEYFRSVGKIICYRQDVSVADVNAYRLKYNIIDPRSVPTSEIKDVGK